MKRQILRGLWLLSLLVFIYCALELATPPVVAHSSPVAPLNPYAGDPLHPDIRVGWCPGGGAQLLNGKGWCDGQDYPMGRSGTRFRLRTSASTRFVRSANYTPACGSKTPPWAAVAGNGHEAFPFGVGDLGRDRWE